MPGLGDILSPTSQAGQMFFWQVIGQIVSTVLEPYFRQLSYLVNENHPIAILSAERLADMVVRGVLVEGDAASEAVKSGYDAGHFHNMVRSAGEPPGPGELAEMLRRGIIERGSPSDDSPSYMGGIAKSRLFTYWADSLIELDKSIPSPTEAVNGAVRAQLGDSDAQALFQKAGGDPNYYQFLYNLAGSGPSPLEGASAAFRGLIPWEGTGPDTVSFAQIVRESSFRNKYTDFYKQVAQYRPPPRTIVAMWREGSMTTEQATKALLNYGVPQEVIPSYLTKTTNSQTQKAKEVTEAEIVRFYTDKVVDRNKAAQLLASINYKSDEIELILSAADIESQRKFTDATVTAIHNLYIGGIIDYNRAITQMDAAGVQAGYRDNLLALWKLELEGGRKPLSEAKVIKALEGNYIDGANAQHRLQQLGYTPEDAALLVRMTEDNAGVLTGQSGVMAAG